MGKAIHQSTNFIYWENKTMEKHLTAKKSQTTVIDENLLNFNSLPLSKYIILLIGISQELFYSTIKDTLSQYYPLSTLSTTLYRLRTNKDIIVHNSHGIKSYTLTSQGMEKLKTISPLLYEQNKDYKFRNIENNRKKKQGLADLIIHIHSCNTLISSNTKPMLSELTEKDFKAKNIFYTKKEILDEYCGKEMVQIQSSIFKGLFFALDTMYITYVINDTTKLYKSNEEKMFSTLQNMCYYYWGKNTKVNILVYYHNNSFQKWTNQSKENTNSNYINNLRLFLTDKIKHSSDIIQVFDNNSLEVFKRIIREPTFTSTITSIFQNKTRPVTSADTNCILCNADRVLNNNPFFLNLSSATHTITKAVKEIKAINKLGLTNLKMYIGTYQHLVPLMEQILKKHKLDNAQIYTVDFNTNIEQYEELLR